MPTIPETDATLYAKDFDATMLVAVYGTVRTGGSLDGWLGEDGWDTPRRTASMGWLTGYALYEHPSGHPYPVCAPLPEGRTRVEVLACDDVGGVQAFLQMEVGAGYTTEYVIVTLDDGRECGAIVCSWLSTVGPRIPGDDWAAIDHRVVDRGDPDWIVPCNIPLARVFDPTEQDPT